MPVKCEDCGKEKAKSLMHRVGVNGTKAQCKACHYDGHAFDEFDAARWCVRTIERLETQDAKHRVIRALLQRYAI